MYRIQRVKKRKGLGTINLDEKHSFKKHLGELMAAWPGGISRHVGEKSFYLAKMHFQWVDKHGLVGNSSTSEFDLKTIGKFRYGTLWKGDSCQEEVKFLREAYFHIDFTFYRFVSRATHSYLDGLLRNAKFMPPPKTENSWLIELKDNNGVTLLIPCLEFFNRCYGRRKTIQAALLDYPRPDVDLSQFGKRVDTNDNEWVVRLNSNSSKKDYTFLAHFMCDPHTFLVYKKLNADARAWFSKNGNGFFNPQVAPWFKGEAGIGGRGIWLEPNKTYLCLDITFFTDPDGPKFTVIRSEYPCA